MKNLIRPGGLTYKHGLLSIDIGTEYTDDEVEFLRAMEHYMSTTKRRFPTFCEVLNVARSLGYRRVRNATTAALPVEAFGKKRESKAARLVSEEYE